MPVRSELFKTYDIRGQALTMDEAKHIGRAIGTYFNTQYHCSICVVGYDIRHNSLALRDGLSAGLVASGLHVVDIGLCATPTLYYTIADQPAMGGVMITASHLGPKYNGFKLSMGKKLIFADEIQVICHIAETGQFVTSSGAFQPDPEATRNYQAFLNRAFSGQRSLKIVVDAGNGMGGLFAPTMLRAAGHQVIELYTDPHPDFPNHLADPSQEKTLSALKQVVLTEQADLGLAFDGDADRVGVVDERGQFVRADMVLAWLAKLVIETQPALSGKPAVVADISSSQVVFDAITTAGGIPVVAPTGHAFVRTAVLEHGAVLGGEASGHMFFADRYWGFDDGIYAGGRIAEALSQSPVPLSEQIQAWLTQLPAYFTTPIYRPSCPPHTKEAIIAYLHQALADYPIVEMGGLKVEMPEGFAILRASNTEDKLSLRFEAKTEAQARACRDRVFALIQQNWPEIQLDEPSPLV
jgi:phosphomannomutase/phosphoglucomutase